MGATSMPPLTPSSLASKKATGSVASVHNKKRTSRVGRGAEGRRRLPVKPRHTVQATVSLDSLITQLLIA